MKKSQDFIQTKRKMLIGSQKSGAGIYLWLNAIRTKINFTAAMK